MQNSFATLEVEWTLPPSTMILNLFTKNVILNTYLQKVNSKFVELMQLQPLWEWATKYEELWHGLWLKDPFMYYILVEKSLKGQ